MVIVKLNGLGEVQWVKKGGLLFDCGLGTDLILDSEGNIYAVGAGPPDNFLLAKFNVNGTQLWAKSWGNLHEWQVGTSVALDPVANVLYCGGYSTLNRGFLLKYDLNGTLLNEKKNFGGLIPSWKDFIPCVKLDWISSKISFDNGSIYFPSFSNSYPKDSNELSLHRFDSDLNELSSFSWGVRGSNTIGVFATPNLILGNCLSPSKKIGVIVSFNLQELTDGETPNDSDNQDEKIKEENYSPMRLNLFVVFGIAIPSFSVLFYERKSIVLKLKYLRSKRLKKKYLYVPRKLVPLNLSIDEFRREHPSIKRSIFIH